MNIDEPSGAERRQLRSIWIAIAWLEGLNVLGVCLVVGAALTTLTFFGGESEPMSGGATAAFVAGWIALGSAPVLAARSSGWPLWFGVGILAALATVGGFALGAALFGDFALAMVLALAAQGAVAVRAPSRTAWVLRPLVLAVLLVLAGPATGDDEDGVLTLVLLTLPAIGLADSVALILRPRAAPTLGAR